MTSFTALYPATFASLIYLFLLYFVALIANRPFLSPYAAFPGPKLAAVIHCYTFYYDVIKGGQYIHKIEEMHRKYGPIVRISPNEIHINDPDFYDILFSNGKRDKPPTWATAFGNPGSMFSTTPQDLHRIRRPPLSPYFSPTSVRKLETLIQEDISRLVAVFRNYQSTGNPIPLKAAFAALTSDIIIESSFATPENYIAAPDFNAIVLVDTEGATDNLHLVLQFKWIVPLMKSLPESIIVMLLGPGMALLQQFQRKHCESQMKMVMRTVDDYKPNVQHKAIFHEILGSNLPPQEKTTDRLWQEAQTIVSAGTATTATTISSALVYLLLDPPRLHILLTELENAIPDISKPASHKQLEQLAYLTAVIQETLRLVSGISIPLASSAPDETLKCSAMLIPLNIANLNVTDKHVHACASAASLLDAVSRPDGIHPERWLPGGSANPKYLVPYSRGTRRCLGMELANAKSYMTIATVLRAFVRREKAEDGSVKVQGMRLFETDRRDVDMGSDFGLPRCEIGRGNVRVMVE